MRWLLHTPRRPAASTAILSNAGTYADTITSLSNANVGEVVLTNCYAGAFESSLDLSSNRLTAAQIETLVTAIHAAIKTGESGARLTLDISSNEPPNAATLVLIGELEDVGCVITHD